MASHSDPKGASSSIEDVPPSQPGVTSKSKKLVGRSALPKTSKPFTIHAEIIENAQMRSMVNVAVGPDTTIDKVSLSCDVLDHAN